MILRLTFMIALLALSTNVWCSGQPKAVILEHNTQYELVNDRLIERTSIHTQINSPNGQKLGEIGIPYQVGDKLKILEAVILDINGSVIRKLSKKDIVDRSDISAMALYEDDFVKTFDLVWNTFPYQIRYAYERTTTEFLNIAFWAPTSWSEILVKQASLSVKSDTNYELIIEASDKFEYTESKAQESLLRTWTIKDYIFSVNEHYAPPARERIDFVKVLPKNFKYGESGSFDSWKEYGNWQFNTNKGLDQLTVEEKIKVNKMLLEATNPKQKIDILYRYLQRNTRYIYVAEDIGGLKPYPASYVCEKKYGDCKALTIYMKALLAHAGIASYYTKVYAGRNPARVDVDFPSQQSNHVILAVPLESDTIWLENTSPYNPTGYLGPFTQNRKGFLIKQNESQLVNIPAMNLTDVANVTSYDILIEERGMSNISVSDTLRGAMFGYFIELENSGSSKNIEKFVKNRVNIRYAKDLTWSSEYKDDSDASVVLNIAGKAKKIVKKVGDKYVLSAMSMDLPTLESKEDRTQDVRVPLPVNKRIVVKYDLSQLDFYDVSMPDDINVDSKYGRFSIEYHKVGVVISVQKTYQLYTGDYSLEEYAAFYDFVNEAKKADKQARIILNQ